MGSEVGSPVGNDVGVVVGTRLGAWLGVCGPWRRAREEHGEGSIKADFTTTFRPSHKQADERVPYQARRSGGC